MGAKTCLETHTHNTNTTLVIRTAHIVVNRVIASPHFTAQESDEFVENILADVKTLGLRHEPLTYTSDYFDQMIDLTRRLIKAGHVYADDTPLEQMREVHVLACCSFGGLGPVCVCR